MKWKRSPKQTTTFMVSLYSTRIPRSNSMGERTAFSINGAGTTGYPFE